MSEETTFHEDYTPRPPGRSLRHRLAEQTAGDLALLDPDRLRLSNGVQRHERGMYYFVPFKVDGVQTGEIRIYGPDYFCVIWEASSGSGLEAHGSRLFEGPEKALTFLELAFLKEDPASALQVSPRVSKRKKPLGEPSPAGRTVQDALQAGIPSDFLGADRIGE